MIRTILYKNAFINIMNDVMQYRCTCRRKNMVCEYQYYRPLRIEKLNRLYTKVCDIPCYIRGSLKKDVKRYCY